MKNRKRYKIELQIVHQEKRNLADELGEKASKKVKYK